MINSIDVAWTGLDVDDAFVLGKTVVVIDVLRATTMIATLFSLGVREIFPVTDVEEARKLAVELTGSKVTDTAGAAVTTGASDRVKESGPQTVLLAGERGGLPPEGFDLGNSPNEVTPEMVNDRSAVLTTTNGTRAINRSCKGDQLVTAAFVNAEAVVRFIKERDPARLLIVCAGTSGKFSLDDSLCAGLLVSRLVSDGTAYDLTDSALAAQTLYEHHADNLFQAVSGCLHGKRLIGLGLKDDVTFALDVDSVDVVPKLSQSNGRYTLIKR